MRAVEDGEDGDDTGIGDKGGVDFDDEPDDNGVGDRGGAEEQWGRAL